MKFAYLQILKVLRSKFQWPSKCHKQTKRRRNNQKCLKKRKSINILYSKYSDTVFSIQLNNRWHQLSISLCWYNATSYRHVFSNVFTNHVQSEILSTKCNFIYLSLVSVSSKNVLFRELHMYTPCLFFQTSLECL